MLNFRAQLASWAFI